VATAEQLLRLYPRAWRARYGGEFLETAGADRLSAQQIIDITMGAIDAWLSSDVRRATGAPAKSGGTPMTAKAVLRCSESRLRMTTRDGLISAAVLLATTLLLSVAGIWTNRSGYHETGEVLKGLAFPVSLLVSMPFGIMKGQPWRAQAFVLGVTLAILVVITFASVKI
jgi:hypothetical protein